MSRSASRPPPSSTGLVTPPPELAALARERAAIGFSPAARKLGISRAALIAVATGVPVRRGTILVVAQALKWPGPAAASPRPSSPPERAAS